MYNKRSGASLVLRNSTTFEHQLEADDKEICQYDSCKKKIGIPHESMLEKYAKVVIYIIVTVTVFWGNQALKHI